MNVVTIRRLSKITDERRKIKMVTDNADTCVIHTVKNAEDGEIFGADLFTRIYLQYCKPVYNFMRFRINDRYEAEELTSDIFEKIIAKYHTFREKKSNLEVWIFTIAKNTLNDYLRRRYRNKKLFAEFTDDIPSVSIESDPQNILVLDEETSAVIESLAVLNKNEKSVVSLKYGGGLKNKDIAKILGLSEKNIGVILCRSMKKLRKNLEANYNHKN